MAIIPYENIYRNENQVDELYRSGNEIVKMYRSGELIYYKLNNSQPTPPVPPGPEETPLTFNILSAGTIYWKAQNTAYTISIDYKLNEGEWTTITSNTGASAPSISVSAGDVLQFKGNNAAYSSDFSYYNSFGDSTAKFELEGNIMSLIDSTNFATATTLASSNTFYHLFTNCTGLTSAENLLLPATTLAEVCYSAMFQGCTSLTTAPALPATTLANYCYRYMFSGCTSLTTAPVLPATTLANSCYYYMFYRCTALNYIKCLATDISASNCTSYWVYGVASTGTFVTPSSTDWSTGARGIPSGWTRVDA